MRAMLKSGGLRAARRLFFVASTITFCMAFAGQALADANGRTGRSGAPPQNRDCTDCHNAGAAVPTVSLNGPIDVVAGSVNSYTFSIMGGPASVAGWNVAASDGSLSTSDPNSQLRSNELTHTSPTPFAAGGVDYVFEWTAPAVDGTYTLYGAGLSGDGDGSEAGDGTTTTSLAIVVTGGSGAPGPAPAPPPATPAELTAVITGPDTATEGVELDYNGDNSTATGVEIATYDWDFGDGTTATGVSVTHVFAAGDFVVSLVVTDDAGATSTAELGVAITPAGADTSPGAILFADNCASCHGADGSGGDAPAIADPGADSISEAIDTVPDMQPLADVLTADDIDAIATFLDGGAGADTIGPNAFARASHPTSHYRTSNGTSSEKKRTVRQIDRAALSVEFALGLFALLTAFRYRILNRVRLD